MRPFLICAGLTLLAACATTDPDVVVTRAATTPVIAETEPTNTPAPQWYLDEVEFLTRDGGHWQTSNAKYQSENEPMEAYVLIWTKGYGNAMTGRMYALVDGKATGNFWEFHQYWHPGKGKAVMSQFGWGGAIGVGASTHKDGVSKMAQTFYAPDGTSSVIGHRSENREPDTHITESFNIVDGEWQPDRIYEWHRVAQPEATE